MSGWSLLVGALLVVLPVHLAFGRGIAVYASYVVAASSLCLAWLGVEFAGALRAASPAREREAVPVRALGSRTH